jgi:beta-glucanase (GH16 family)
MLVAAAAGAQGTLPDRGAQTRTVVFDGFVGASLDRPRWTVRGSDEVYNDEQQLYVDSAANLYVVHGAAARGASGGALVIRATWAPGGRGPKGEHLDFHSARLDTRGKMEFTYGSVAARMRLPAGAGLWPAFWILGTGDWPATGEIDVMEAVGDPEWTSVALHGPGYSGDTPLFNRWYFPPHSDITGWHVYAVDWSPQALVFTVDGRVVYRASRAMIEHYGRFAFDNPKYLILNLALGGAYPLKVNGAKKPYPGLPQSTVDGIRRGQATVLVDWVRVTTR